MKFYANKLKTLRNARAIAVKDIIREVGITVNTYYRWERGEITPSVNNVRILAHILDIDVGYISDLKALKKYDNIYNKAEIEELFSNKKIPVDIKNKLILLNNTLKGLTKENNTLKYENKKLQNNLKLKLIPEYIKDVNLKFVYCNRALKNILGKEKTYSGHDNYEFFKKDEAALLSKIERLILQTGESVSNYKISLDGSYYLLFGTRYIVSREEAPYVLINLIDVDYYEKTLEEYKNYFSCFDNIDAIIWVKKLYPTPYYECFSQNAEKLLGYNLNYFFSNPDAWRGIVHPDDLGVRIPVQPLVKDARNSVYKYRIITEYKDVKWIEERIFYDDNSDKFIGFVFDITNEMIKK